LQPIQVVVSISLATVWLRVVAAAPPGVADIALRSGPVVISSAIPFRKY